MKGKCIILFLGFVFVSCNHIQFNPQTMFDVDAKYTTSRNGNQNEQNKTLFDAVKASDIDAVEDVLDKKPWANRDVADMIGQSVLMWACWNERQDIIERLVTYNDDKRKLRPHINNPSKKKYTALLVCALKGNQDIFMFLMSEYAGDKTAITAKDENKEGILHKAAKSGNVRFMEYLIKNYVEKKPNLSINDQDKNGYTPLHVAVLARDETMVDTLLKYNADPMISAKFSNENTTQDIYPLFSAYHLKNYGIYISILEKMNKNGISQVKDDKGNYLENILKLPEREDIEEDLEYIYHISLDRKNKGETPIEAKAFLDAINSFYDAIRDDSLDNIRKYGNSVLKDINRYGPKGGEPLLITAARRNDISIVQYLLENNFQTSDDNNLLVTVAKYALDDSDKKYQPLLTYLLNNIDKYSAIKQLTGKDFDSGNTALMYLVKNTGYLNNLDWNFIRRFFDMYYYAGVLRNRNDKKEWILTDIIENRSKHQDKMFEYIYSTCIARTPSIRADNDTRVIHYAFNKGYYYGVEYLIKNDPKGVGAADPDSVDKVDEQNLKQKIANKLKEYKETDSEYKELTKLQQLLPSEEL